MKTHRHNPFGLPLRLALLLAICVVVGFGFLLAAYTLPVAPIAKQVRLSVPALNGDWATGEIAYEQLVKGYLSTQLDNSTDANMMLAALHEVDRPLLQMAIDVPMYTYEGRCYPALLQYGQSGTAALNSSDVARYWLGFLVFLKPLLMVFSYQDIRILLMTVQLLMLCAVAAGLAHRGLLRFGPAFALSMVAITPAITGFSLQFSTVLMLFLSAMLLQLYIPGLFRTPFRVFAYFLLLGAATSYFDYLTYPIATFGMPFLLDALLRPAASVKEAFARFVKCLLVWVAGYFGMWAGKWVIASLLGTDGWFIPNLLAKITERSGYEAADTVITLKMLFAAVFGVFAKKAYLAIALLLALVYGFLLIRKSRRPLARSAALPSQKASVHGQALLFALTAALPIAWYLLASNHTYNHAFFTSRALCVTVFGLALLFTLPLQGGKTPLSDAKTE